MISVTKATAPTAEEIQSMRRFLARVIRTPPQAIKATGNPATDENSDLLTTDLFPEEVAAGVTYKSLSKTRALEIDSILAGHWPEDLRPDGMPDIERGILMFSHFVAHPLRPHRPT